LNGAQELALIALVDGQTVTEAASRARVTRQTVSLWLNQDAVFIALYNQRRAQLWAEHELKLASLMGTALDALQDILENSLHTQAPQRLKAALAVLAMAREKGQPKGPMTEEDVQDEWASEAETRLYASLARAGLGDLSAHINKK